MAEYKKYRDLIIHSSIFDVDRCIGQHINNKAEAIQILLTQDALSALYERLDILAEELRFADLLFRLGNKDSATVIYRGERDTTQSRRERDVPQFFLKSYSIRNVGYRYRRFQNFPRNQKSKLLGKKFYASKLGKCPRFGNTTKNATAPAATPPAFGATTKSE